MTTRAAERQGHVALSWSFPSLGTRIDAQNMATACCTLACRRRRFDRLQFVGLLVPSMRTAPPWHAADIILRRRSQHRIYGMTCHQENWHETYTIRRFI